MSRLMIGDPRFPGVFSAGQAFHRGHLYLITRRQACGHTACLALSCFPQSLSTLQPGLLPLRDLP